MTGPAVVDGHLVLTVADPHHDLREVELSCDDAIATRHRFRRTRGGWQLRLALPDVARLEYRLVVTDEDGNTDVMVDPANDHSVATAFGQRSVVQLPGYTAPWWLDHEPTPARRSHAKVPSIVGTIPVTTWHPDVLADTDTAPLLVVHDGPEYDRLADLGRWAGVMVAEGRLPAFRMALLQPLHRDAWYAADPRWPRAVDQVLGMLSRSFPSSARAVMGASLGGLAALQVAVARPTTFGAVFTQSGSFFRPDLDPQESAHPRFDEITTWVAEAGSRAREIPRMAVGMTCGRHEENHANNEAMRDVLAAAGHEVTFRSLADLHNYTAWRDGLSPTLADLLAAAWRDHGPAAAVEHQAAASTTP